MTAGKGLGTIKYNTVETSLMNEQKEKYLMFYNYYVERGKRIAVTLEVLDYLTTHEQDYNNIATISPAFMAAVISNFWMQAIIELDAFYYVNNDLSFNKFFNYSKQNANTIDMVLSLNGIPVVALELKNQYKGQNVQCAVEQFKNDRDPKEFCFRFNHRLGRLSSIIKPIVDRYLDISTEEERFNCRLDIRKFVKCYAYITQLVRLHDEELFKEYVFLSNLLPLLPVDVHYQPDILDKIKLEYTSLKESFAGAILLDKKDTELVPSSDKSKAKTPKRDTLQNIIDKVNERFDGDFSEGDRVIIESIYQMFMSDKEVKKFKRYAHDTTPEMFVTSLFPDKFKEIATQCYLENADSYKKLFSDTEFYQKVMEAMARELYKSLRKD